MSADPQGADDVLHAGTDVANDGVVQMVVMIVRDEKNINVGQVVGLIDIRALKRHKKAGNRAGSV